MAVTASIALSTATVKSGQKTAATLTVSNSGAAAVLVTGIQPTLVINGNTTQNTATAVGVPMWGGPFNQSVPASGSTPFYFDVVPLAPTTSQGLAEPASLVYSVGATVSTNDGSVTVATPATVTATNPAGL